MEEWDEQDEKEKSEEEKMKEYKDLVKDHEVSESALLDKQSEADLEKMAKQETQDDEQFSRFKKRIANDPSQVCILIEQSTAGIVDNFLISTIQLL